MGAPPPYPRGDILNTKLITIKRLSLRESERKGKVGERKSVREKKKDRDRSAI